MRVLVLIPTKDSIEPDCLEAVLNQDYQDYSLLTGLLQPIKLHDDPEKNRVTNVVRNRNYMRKLALASDAEWFFWVDSDTVPPRNAISEFMKVRLPLMGGWYKKVLGNDWVGSKWVADGIFYLYQEPQKGVVPVDMMGLGCVMMHRSILEKIDFKPGTEIYSKDTFGRVYFYAECMYFCQEAKRIGIVPHLLGSIVCRHINNKTEKRDLL